MTVTAYLIKHRIGILNTSSRAVKYPMQSVFCEPFGPGGGGGRVADWEGDRVTGSFKSRHVFYVSYNMNLLAVISNQYVINMSHNCVSTNVCASLFTGMP